MAGRESLGVFRYRRGKLSRWGVGRLWLVHVNSTTWPHGRWRLCWQVRGPMGGTSLRKIYAWGDKR